MATVKMLTVIHLYPPHHLGGYEVACQSVMERFAERGIEVEVLTADHHMPPSRSRLLPPRTTAATAGAGSTDLSVQLGVGQRRERGA